MEFFSANYITFGFLLLLLALLYKYYLNYKKKLEGFPFIDVLSHLVYSHLNGKITKDTSFNNVIFEKLVQSGKEHIKEGLFMTFTTKPLLFVYGEEAIKFFLNEKAASDKSSDYKFLQEIMGAGINSCNGERWRKHRKMINPVFNMVRLKQKVTLFNEHAMSLVQDMEKMAGKPSVDILDALKCHLFNSLCESVLGLKVGEENKPKIQTLGRYVDDLTAMSMKRMFYPWLRPKSLLSLFPSGREFHQQNKACADYINQIITDIKKNISSSKTVDDEQFGTHLSKSFTYILLNHHLNDPTFTFYDLHSEVKTIISTGFHTTTYATLFCLFLLGLHQEIQEKVFREIQSTVSDYVTYEESCNLTYLDAVIQESLRLYATVPIFLRNLSEDVQYGKYKVFKGTDIAFFPYVSQRNPNLYPDPEQFKPERFLNGDLKKMPSFLPFSEGSRSCIGKNYALIEMKVFLAHILRNFQITSLDRKEDVRLSWQVVICPTKPLRMKIMRRQ